MTIEELKQKLLNGFKNATITVDGDGCNCSCVVISDEFENMSLLNRQKMVLKIVDNEIKSGELHALSIKTKTTAEA